MLKAIRNKTRFLPLNSFFFRCSGMYLTPLYYIKFRSVLEGAGVKIADAMIRCTLRKEASQNVQ